MPAAAMRRTLVYLWIASTGVAQAQPPPSGDALSPPRLVELAEAEVPEAAQEARIEGGVVLEIEVAADGTVTDARVVEGLGHGLDEAAVAAIRRSRFEPARRGETAIPARIRFRYVFELVPDTDTDTDADTATETDTEPDTVDGSRVTEDGPRITDTDPDPPSQVVITDDQGFGVSARVRRPPREAVRHTLRGEELTWLPGTAGDPLRALEVLPGVGRPPFGTGLLLVRGASPQETQAFFGGMPVPLLYHFGGLTSFVQPPLIEQIDFYPGNFSVRYGRKVGGAVEVVPRDPPTEDWGGEVDVDLLDASFVVEGPLSDTVSVGLAARRSYIDAFFETFVPGELFDVVAAPVYYDYQAFLTSRPSADDTLRFMVYGSSDSLALIFSDPPQNDPVVRGNVQVETEFHRVHAGWERRISEDVDQEIAIALGPTHLGFRLGDPITLETETLHVWSRAEWRVRLSHAVELSVGWDALIAPYDLLYRGPAPRQTEGNPTSRNPVTAEPVLEERAEGTQFHPALYLESALHPVPSLRLVLGVRVDYYSEIDEHSFDPRLVAIQTIAERTRVKLGVGLFSQPPSLQEAVPGLGNPDLEPTTALHLGAGVEHELPAGFEIGADGFYKYLWSRVVSTPSGAPPFFSNDGEGRIYGLELFGRVPFGRQLFGMFSYTLSRSERRDADGRWRAFDYDQTHVLVAAAGLRLGRGWEAGVAFRLVSGNPYTPIVAGELDLNHGVAVPIYGELNSARNPLFHRLDARIEKTWTFPDWRLSFRIDVQNVYNATNREGEIYSWDFRESTDLPGLPIIPSIGVKGAM